MSKKRVAILGGTFDPPHLGHLVLAEQVKIKYNLSEIIFMPAGQPPHKKNKKISPNKDRLKMLKMVIDENKYFSLSDWEMKQKGYSYTHNTVKNFVPTINTNNEEIFFIIGADSLAEIFSWKKPDYLLSQAKFIVFNRTNFNLKKLLKKDKFKKYLENIYPYYGLNIEISSSFIRKEVKKRNSIRYLTTDKIRFYIENNDLYR